MKKGMKVSQNTLAKMRASQQKRVNKNYITCTAYELQLMGYKWALDNIYVTKDGKVIKTKFFDCENHYKVITPSISKAGYEQVAIDKKNKAIGVHTLVMLAWVGKKPKGMEIDHINRIKTDNRLENLRYVTHKENMANASKPDTHNYYGRYCISTQKFSRPNGEQVSITPLNFYLYMKTVDSNRASRFLSKHRALIESYL